MSYLNTNNILLKHIIEIRYKPWFDFVGIKGELLDALIKKTSLKEWEFSEIRITLKASKSDKDNYETAFVSYNNCGYECLLPSTHNYFKDKFSVFLNVLAKYPKLAISEVIRIGLRTMAFIPSDKDFVTLEQRLIDQSFNTSGNLIKAISGKFTDVSVIFEMEDGGYRKRIQFGPMAKKQAKGYFLNEQKISSQGLFIDIDLSTPRDSVLPFNENQIVGFLDSSLSYELDQIENISKEL